MPGHFHGFADTHLRPQQVDLSYICTWQATSIVCLHCTTCTAQTVTLSSTQQQGMISSTRYDYPHRTNNSGLVCKQDMQNKSQQGRAGEGRWGGEEEGVSPTCTPHARHAAPLGHKACALQPLHGLLHLHDCLQVVGVHGCPQGLRIVHHLPTLHKSKL